MLPPSPAPRQSAGPAHSLPPGRAPAIAQATPVVHPPSPARAGDPSSAERAAPSPVQRAVAPQLAARPEPSLDEAAASAPSEPPATPAGHARASGRRHPRAAAGRVILAERPLARSTSRLVAAAHGMTPAPPTSIDPFPASGATDSSSGEPGSAAPASAGPDPYPDEPITMMASMPEMPSGAELEPMPSSDDDLAELRQRLAIQRRQVPTFSVGSVRRSHPPVPPHFEF
jgi:hypothetical protein